MLKEAMKFIKDSGVTPEKEALYKALQEDLDSITGSGEIRCLFNLCSLKEWANNYEYRGTDSYKEDLW